MNQYVVDLVSVGTIAAIFSKEKVIKV